MSAVVSTDAAIRVTVNGRAHETAVQPEDAALEVLRDRLGLTGTKLVCGEGVCGACTILLDGVPVNACLLPAVALDGRVVETVEAFADHPVQRAFKAHDALQCGYCTPGFVVEAIAFHARWRAERGNVEPSRDDVVQALAGHLCRCGSYAGIIGAVRAACAGDFDLAESGSARADADEKVTGRAVYTADVQQSGQLEGRILRSPYPHARVRRLDLERARAHPGVRAAVDLRGSTRVVRYVGQEVAAVAAVDRRTAEAALSLIRVDYEPLLHCIGAEAAQAPDAPRVYDSWWPKIPNSFEGLMFPARWRRNLRGPVFALSQRPFRARRLIAAARERGDPLLIEGHWRTQAQVHTAFEPHACVARWGGERLHLRVSTQAAVQVAEQVAKRFRLPVEDVQVIAEHVGGAFGAKLTLTPEIVAAVELARVAAAPVRVALDRAEEMSVGGYRPGTEIMLKMLVDPSGHLSALQLHVYGDAGVAGGSQIAPHARMIYPAPAKELFDYDVVSHLPPGTPFRGPGVPALAWALEQAVDEAAHRLGEDPIALRCRWDPHPGRQRLYGWAAQLELWRSRPETGAERGRYRRGVGVAAANWIYFYQIDCEVDAGLRNGRLHVATAVQDIGTGIRSVLAQTCAAVFGVAPAEVEVRLGDTRLGRGPVSASSRTTATLVPATLAAATRLRDTLARALADRYGLRDVRADEMGIHHSGGVIPWAEALASAPDMQMKSERPADEPGRSDAPAPLAGTGLLGWLNVWLMRWLLKLQVGRGYPGAVHVAEVEVDTLLGRTRVLRVAAGISAGRIALPALARSQCQGGAIQGIGYALYEHRAVDPADGRLLAAGLEDYRIPGIGDVPEIDVHFDEKGFEHVHGGGVGLSELSTLAVAACIGNAVHNATGWRPFELPIRPDRMLDGLAP